MPRTIQDAVVEFGSYSRESVAEAIVKLIEAQLLLEYGSSEWQRDALVESSWKPWLPAGGFHFLTKDAAYVGGDWTVEQKMKVLPTTPAPPPVKTLGAADPLAPPRHPIHPDTF